MQYFAVAITIILDLCSANSFKIHRTFIYNAVRFYNSVFKRRIISSNEGTRALRQRMRTEGEIEITVCVLFQHSVLARLVAK